MAESKTPDGEANRIERLSRASRWVLLAAAAPPALLLLMALRHLHADVRTDQLVLFYLLPAAALLTLAWLLRSEPSTRIQGALAIVAIGAALLVSEAALSLTALAENGRGREASGPSMYDHVQELRSRGIEAYARAPGNVLVDLGPALEAGTTVVHPITPGPGNTTIALCAHRQDPRFVSYEADRFGFRNSDGVWESGRVDVALIGDSYTHGVCVDTEDALSAHLSRRWRVLNLGATGAGPFQELAILREYAAPLEPPLVVWIYYEGNDLWDVVREAPKDWLAAYLAPGHRQGLAGVHGEVSRAFGAWLDSLTAAEANRRAPDRPSLSSTLAEIPRFRQLRSLLRVGVWFPSREAPLRAVPDVLLRARADVAAWGGTLFLVYLPAYSRYASWIGESHAGHNELIDFARASGIPVIDLHEVFLSHGDPESLWTDPGGHLTPDGYRLVAQAIARAIGPDVDL